MSEASEYGASTCAFAAVPAKTNPTDKTHPVNSFMPIAPVMSRHPGRFRPFVPAATSSPNWAVLGRDRGALASKPGAAAPALIPGQTRHATGDSRALV